MVRRLAQHRGEVFNKLPLGVAGRSSLCLDVGMGSLSERFGSFYREPCDSLRSAFISRGLYRRALQLLGAEPGTDRHAAAWQDFMLGVAAETGSADPDFLNLLYFAAMREAGRDMRRISVAQRIHQPGFADGDWQDYVRAARLGALATEDAGRKRSGLA